jgi:hypothetical protein
MYPWRVVNGKTLRAGVFGHPAPTNAARAHAQGAIAANAKPATKARISGDATSRADSS